MPQVEHVMQWEKFRRRLVDVPRRHGMSTTIQMHIEGQVNLLLQEGERYAERLRRHARLLPKNDPLRAELTATRRTMVKLVTWGKSRCACARDQLQEDEAAHGR